MTDEMLQIPALVARACARRARRFGLDQDELESAANLGFVKALERFDAARSPGGAAGLADWLTRGCRMAVKNAMRPDSRDASYRRNRLLFDDVDVGMDRRDDLAVPASPAPLEREEVQALLETVLALLPVGDRLLLEAIRQSDTHRGAIALLGVTKDRFRGRLDRLRRRVRQLVKCHGGLDWPRAGRGGRALAADPGAGRYRRSDGPGHRLDSRAAG